MTRQPVLRVAQKPVANVLWARSVWTTNAWSHSGKGWPALTIQTAIRTLAWNVEAMAFVAHQETSAAMIKATAATTQNVTATSSQSTHAVTKTPVLSQQVPAMGI